MKLRLAPVVALVLTACGPISADPVPEPALPTARILLVGDVMLGRGVANLASSDPDSLFAEVRHLLAAADVVGANLESPLTDGPHRSTNENMLEADPATAAILSAARFDVLSVANNHSTDAGAGGLLDTLRNLRSQGLRSIGGGPSRVEATASEGFDVGGVGIGFVAFDATGVSETATDAGFEPGVATWGEDQLELVAGISELYDVLVVSIHGGTEYLRVTDPGMAHIAADLAEAGADVVWGHGAHIVQPVTVIAGDKPTITATSLGNFLFDQSGPERTMGAILEVLVDEGGVVAYRVGITEHPERRVEFVEWLQPGGDAVWLHDSWWTLTRTTTVEPATPVDFAEFRYGDLIDAARGDITGDGVVDIVASFRRPHQQTPLMDLHPDLQWADANGRSAHVGVYDPEGLREIWVAGTVVMPVAQLAICDGAVATVHDQLDDPALVAGGAWEWNGFGFDTAPDIPGPGTPGCADIDGDGRTEPVILGR
jgi:hypothetical protein